MDAFELNKIAGAVLFALLVLFGTKTATDILFKVHKPEKPGFEVEIAETDAGEKAGGEEEKAVPLANLLAQASAEKGEKVAKKCAACHTFDKGGANKIGPNLYGILGRDLGTVDGFAYSGALKAKGGKWDYEALNAFVASPKGYINGTKMAFPGIKKGDQRADLIRYLRERGDDKPPLPEPQAAPEAEPKAEPKAKPASEKKAAVEQAPDKAAGSGTESLGARLAKADAAKGKEIATACAVCHTFEEGGKNKIGPNLFGVVGRDIGSKPDFEYSQAIKAKGGAWTFAELDCFITKPKACVPGTRMPFPGLEDAAKRADVLAFLRTLSGTPAPLPTP